MNEREMMLCWQIASEGMQKARRSQFEVEVIIGYRQYRRTGDCPCAAMTLALYDWDI
jgi:hypothetical protein